ncbi:hypothetical protein ACFQY5_00135 [Paeniroseomonas aquatica]|uniref:hypothetical protein n=1 Tax=Paeniroseomonas aquatica TaxID=373043 RepID=UPI00361E1377
MLKTTHPAPKIEILSLKGGVLLLQLQDALISPVSGRNLGILSLRGIQSEECDSLSQGSCRAWILYRTWRSTPAASAMAEMFAFPSRSGSRWPEA